MSVWSVVLDFVWGGVKAIFTAFSPKPATADQQKVSDLTADLKIKDAQAQAAIDAPKTKDQLADDLDKGEV